MCSNYPHFTSPDLLSNYLIERYNKKTTAQMPTTLIISKKSLNLELFIDGTIEVRPLPDEVLGEETVNLLVETYQVFLNEHLRQHKGENMMEVAMQYFENKGFRVTER